MGTEKELHQELLSLHRRTGQATGYWPNYFHRAVRESGGLAVAKKLLKPGQASAGFDRLVAASRLDLSVEYIAVREHYAHLFTEEEIAVARRRLKDASQGPGPALPTLLRSSQPMSIGEVSENTDYVEGAVQRVTVNRYERQPAARRACIRYHGKRCKVCDLDFEERYGEPGREFIHVHHTRPLHRMRASNRVDAKRDLVPVCPNCHAMLHQREPPFDVEQLRALLRPLSDPGPVHPGTPTAP